MEDLYLARLDVTLQRHLFEPRPFATTDFLFSGNQAAGDVPYKSAFNVVNTLGVRQQLPYGGEITARQLVTITEALNDATEDGQSARTALTASIPLLRGVAWSISSP